MLIPEVYHVRWLHGALLKVPYLKIFALINGEEFADAGGKSLGRSGLFLDFFAWLVLALIEVELAPFDLGNRTTTFLVPYSQRRRIIFVIKAKKIRSEKFTYHILPQLNATSK